MTNASTPASWRYDWASVATTTATIRVPRRTKDVLSARARERGVSVSTLLTEFARRIDRAAALRSEREASLVDAGNPEVAEEEREWEAIIGDGIA